MVHTQTRSRPSRWLMISPVHSPIFFRLGMAAVANTPSPSIVLRFTMRAAATQANADTFLDTHKVSKGIAFLNEQPLGRFWSVGPQFTLYAPAPWLHAGPNSIVLFDLNGTAGESLTSIDHADYGPDRSR